MITHEQIAQRAYEIYLKNPHHDLPDENWYEAERQLEAEHMTQPIPMPDPQSNHPEPPLLPAPPVVPIGPVSDVPVPTLPLVPPVVVPVLPGTPESSLPKAEI